jgi:hypothetical protein
MHWAQATLLCRLFVRNGMTQSEIAEQLSVQGATVTGMLQRMEEAGLVARRRDTEDNRLVSSRRLRWARVAARGSADSHRPRDCRCARKEYRMMGWHVGWVVGPADMVADVARVSISNVVCQTGIAEQRWIMVARTLASAPRCRVWSSEAWPS